MGRIAPVQRQCKKCSRVQPPSRSPSAPPPSPTLSLPYASVKSCPCLLIRLALALTKNGAILPRRSLAISVVPRAQHFLAGFHRLGARCAASRGRWRFPKSICHSSLRHRCAKEPDTRSRKGSPPNVPRTRNMFPEHPWPRALSPIYLPFDRPLRRRNAESAEDAEGSRLCVLCVLCV